MWPNLHLRPGDKVGIDPILALARAGRLVAPLLVLLAVFFCTPAHAQYRIDHWTSDNGLPQNSVRDILQTRDGYIWFTTFDGLVRFDGVHFTVFNKSNSPDLPGNRFVSLFEDRSGDLWATMEDGKVVQRHRGRFAVFGPGQGLPDKRRPLGAVSIDAERRLWLTDLESGRTDLLSLHTPDGFDVRCVYADAEGNYWFSTYNNGLFRARRQAVTPYGKEQGLDVKEVYPLLESRDGSLWIGAGPDLYRFKDGVFTRYAIPNPFPASVQSLYEDRAGQVWVNGAMRFVDGRLVSAPWTNGAFMASTAMCEDRNGAFWVGSGSGVARHLDGASTYYTTKDGLAGDDTKVIVEDGDGGLWLGSYGGLTHYKDGAFTAWTEKDGLPGDTVRALKQDADGTLWIGTYDSGLGRFKDGRFTTFRVKDGLFDNGVFQILEDDYGWFWMSCNRGIYRVRKQELDDFAEGRIDAITCIAYNKSDGMPSSECNGGRWPAGIKGRDGRLWFPTMGGVAMIDPASVRPNTKPPPVVIERMRIDNESVPVDAWESALGEAGTAIRILPGQDSFEIEYTAPSFVNSENILFKYRLDGLDTNWVEAGTRRSAYFSHVPPGSYTFRVIAANSDGVWNTDGAAVGLVVVPRFYQTRWFLVLAVAIVFGLGLTLYRVRIGRLERVRSEQEEFSRKLLASQERERQRIAGELHDSLGQSLLIIKNRIALARIDIDERATVEEQLDELSQSASAAIEECREIAYNLRPYQISRFGLSKTLYGIFMRINEVTDIAATANVEPIDDLLPDEAQLNVYRIVQECANNIIKHSHATEASLAVERGRGAIALSIRDNGRGFASGDGHGSENGRGGFGLIGIAERVRMLDGTLEIDPEGGTNVRIRIPTTSR